MRPLNICLCLAVLAGLTGWKTATEYKNDMQVRCTHNAEAITRHKPDQTVRELATRRLVRLCMAEAGYSD